MALVYPASLWIAIISLCVIVCGVPQGLDDGPHNHNLTRDESHPLLKVLGTAPHSMSLLIKPLEYQPGTMIRLLYERVPLNKGPFMLHLDDPVIEYIPLPVEEQTHTLAELPMGKYIVCGEAMARGEVYQASCFQTNIRRLDNNSEYGAGFIGQLLF